MRVAAPSPSRSRRGKPTNCRWHPACWTVAETPLWVVGDRGLGSHALRERVWSMGARPAIPPKRGEAPVACPEWICRNRNRVERLWARFKEWRALVTRYEMTARSFMGVLCLAAAIEWIKS